MDKVCGEWWRVVARAGGGGCGAVGYARVGSEELEELDAPEELDEPEELEANCATNPASTGSRNGAAGRAPLDRPICIGLAAKRFMAAGEAASRLCELCWGPATGCSGLACCSASRGLPTPWSCRSVVATAAMAVSIPTALHCGRAARAVLKSFCERNGPEDAAFDRSRALWATDPVVARAKLRHIQRLLARLSQHYAHSQARSD